MKKEIVMGILLALLLASIATLAFNVRPVKASGTIYIRPDGSVEGTDKIQRDGDLYTFTDNIFDSIWIEKDNIIVDGAGNTLQGSGGHGIRLQERSNVTIKNMTIRRFVYGIYLNYTNKITIIDNNITANDGSGIRLFQSSNNNISRNDITNNNYYGNGISLSYSSINAISGNNITNNYDGIELYHSSHNTISGNLFVNNGLVMSESYGSVMSGNLVNGKPLVYLEDASDVVVDDAGQVVLVQCSRIRVANLNLSNATIGVQLWQTNNTEIRGNNITANNRYGIWIRSSSNRNSVIGNNITNSWGGILLDGFSNNNIVSGNNIANNNFCGIHFSYSSNNSIFHNNFIDNPHQVISSTPGYSENRWDDDYHSGGNYWSDYVGVDANGDGIGDSPYGIYGNNTDHYPLMKPWSPSWTGAVETPWFPINPIILAVLITLVVVIVVAVILVRRKKKPPEAQKPEV